jgi:hypothetical protein
MIFLAIPISLSRLYSTFPLRLGTTLIEIAVYLQACIVIKIGEKHAASSFDVFKPALNVKFVLILICM